MAATRKGYKRLRGASRNYLDEQTGEIISDRRYRALRAASGQKSTVSPQRHAIQVRAQRNYNRLLAKYVETERAKGAMSKNKQGKPVPLTKAAARKSRVFKKAIADLGVKGDDLAARKRKRHALVKIGYLRNIPEWVPYDQIADYANGAIERPSDVDTEDRYRA